MPKSKASTLPPATAVENSTAMASTFTPTGISTEPRCSPPLELAARLIDSLMTQSRMRGSLPPSLYSISAITCSLERPDLAELVGVRLVDLDAIDLEVGDRVRDGDVAEWWTRDRHDAARTVVVRHEKVGRHAVALLAGGTAGLEEDRRDVSILEQVGCHFHSLGSSAARSAAAAL